MPLLCFIGIDFSISLSSLSLFFFFFFTFYTLLTKKKKKKTLYTLYLILGLASGAKLVESQMEKAKDSAIKNLESNTDWIDKDAEAEEKYLTQKADDEHRDDDDAKRANCRWIKQKNKGTGQEFYYNVSRKSK